MKTPLLTLQDRVVITRASAARWWVVWPRMGPLSGMSSMRASYLQAISTLGQSRTSTIITTAQLTSKVTASREQRKALLLRCSKTLSNPTRPQDKRCVRTQQSLDLRRAKELKTNIFNSTRRTRARRRAILLTAPLARKTHRTKENQAWSVTILNSIWSMTTSMLLSWAKSIWRRQPTCEGWRLPVPTTTCEPARKCCIIAA